MHDQSSKYTLRQLQPGEETLWNDFIEENNLPLFFGLKWARIIQTLTGRPYKILLIEKNEVVQGGLLYWPHKRFGLHALTPVPFTPYTGPVLKQESAEKNSTRIAFNSQCHELLARHLLQRFDFIRITTHPQLSDIRPYLWSGFEAFPFYTYRLPLDGNAETRYNNTLKRQIRTAEKEGLSVETSGECEPIADFVEQSYRAHGFNPPLPKKDVLRLTEAVLREETGRLFYVYTAGGERIGGVLLTEDRNTVYYTLSGIKRAYKHVQPMAFLLHSVFGDERLRHKEFDFIGANTPALEQFKRGFGGSLIPYYGLSRYRSGFVRKIVQINEALRHNRKKQV